MTRWFPALALVLAACGTDPVAACEDYSASAAACSAEAYGGTSNTGDPFGGMVTCEQLYGDVGKSAGKAAEKAFTCYAETFDNADCSTPQGWFDANDAICDCEDALPGQCSGG